MFKYNSIMNNFIKIKILIVEDESDIQSKLAEYVSLFCDVVYKAGDGKEGYELYKKYSPNIILTDINMPHVDGFEFIKQIRSGDNETQIIILTAHSNIDYLIQATELNLLTYLLKPFNIDKLDSAITKAIQRVKDSDVTLLKSSYCWDSTNKTLYNEDKKVVSMSNYETLLVECLFKQTNECVPYEELHNYIYDLEEFSQDAITSLVKRLRKKTTKKFITSCYSVGYKIV
ncbi:MAG: response regulator [Helicobacteraceae bacterium]|nr:response regulator [Helicobacteraceae bacterium]